MNNNKSLVKTLFYVLLSLIALTIVTVLVSYIHFEHVAISIIVAMSIASLKGFLVLYFFMHLKWEDDKLIKRFAFLAFPFLILMFLFLILDIVIKTANNLFFGG